MTRRLLVAATLLVAVSVWADDPWKKPYKQWDAKDVRQILNDSPWSKLVEAERQSKKHEELEAPEGAPKVSGAHQEDDEDEDEAEEKHHGREKDKDKDEEEREHAKFAVRWVSARTLREASVRGQVLQGRIPEADSDKSLPPAADDYELAVVGTDMTSFQNADESALTNKSYLIAKKSKEKIAATVVEIVQGADGKKINALIFHFPKKNAAGQPTVSADEKELKFVTRGGAIEIKVSFDLQKMVDQQGEDL